MWSVLRSWSMSRGPRLTDGTGAGTARNIPCTSTLDVLGDLTLTFATNAKAKKTGTPAKPEDIPHHEEEFVEEISRCTASLCSVFP